MARARLVEVLEPAATRVEPPCEYYARCGGCHYQHLPYEEQLRAKQAILGEVLERVGKIEPPEIGVISGPPLEYRNRVQFHVEEARLGFHQAGSHVLQPVLRCVVASPAINEALAVLRRMAHQPRFPTFVRSIELFSNGDQMQVNVTETSGPRVAASFFDWCAKLIPGYTPGAIDYAAAGETFRVGHRSFFQVNRFLVDRLVEAALEGATGERALDLYAGVGLFSVALARRFGAVKAVESGRGAVDDLSYNAERAGVAVEVERSTAQLVLEGIPAEKRPDFVLADPPRAGLGKAVVKELVRLRAPRLTIVSCDPSTLARDLAVLLAAGYGIEGMTMVDLFPETYHIETVVRLALV